MARHVLHPSRAKQSGTKNLSPGTPDRLSSVEMSPRHSLVPKYFFNVYDDRPNIDPDGDELPDRDAAWRGAICTVVETLCDGELTPGRECRLEVTEELKNGLGNPGQCKAVSS